MARWWLALFLASVVGAQTPLDDLSRPQVGRSRRVSSTAKLEGQPRGDLNEASNHDNFRVAPGATHVVMDQAGPGVITHMWFTFLGPGPQDWAPQGSANHQEMLLRITWDGQAKPAVEAPLGDFFANCFGRRDEVISEPVVVEDADSYNCFWRMPFRKHAKIEIVNQSKQAINLLYYNIDWLQVPSLPADTPYFHAQYRQEYPAVSGRDYVVLDTKGKGHYVGTVMAVRTRSPMWFGEGDEKIYVDGEAKPSIWGTGTEDYFLSAWGLKRTKTPYFGVPYFDTWGVVGGHTSAYRWHLKDPIVFGTGLKVTFEHFGWISADENADGKVNSWNERQDDVSSVAYWYQTGESAFNGQTPDGPERRLPSLERTIAYARDGARHSAGDAVAQRLDLYDGPQLLFKPEKAEGAWLEVPFRVERKEPLHLVLNLTTSYDFGRWQPSLNGVKLGGPIDFYSEDVDSTEVHLLDFWPEPGEYVLRLDCVGENAKSKGCYLGLESVRLRERRPRVAEYGRDKDKDWRTAPTLYR
ncbi:MAG: DUF2961 domain-containing protein [Armatimonadetes bacterium]|nr:DUF2961 domain-containing protein [Armatimonadota bacterium]